MTRQIECTRKKIKTGIRFRLTKNTRCRIYEYLKDISKSSSTIVILGIDIDTYKKWIEYQFTPQMNWSKKN